MSTRVLFLRPGGLFGLILMIAVFVGLYFVAVGVFKLLSFIAPVLILLAAIIHYKTILNFLRYMLDLIRRRPLVGILGAVLSVVGFPVLSAVLFGKSILDRQVRKLEQAHKQAIEGEYVEFEEVVRQEDAEFIELPPIEPREAPREAPREENPYKDLF